MRKVFRYTILATCLLMVPLTTVKPSSAMPDTSNDGNYMYFERNWSDPTDGRLYVRQNWHNKKAESIPWPPYTKSWNFRAGSGNGGTNTCQKNNMLPGGMWYHTNYEDWEENKDNTIKGRVMGMSSYTCRSNGVTRSALFVHSEQTKWNYQKCWSGYDERYCWDGDKDYYSLGCIKLTPWDMEQVFDFFKSKGVKENTYYKYAVFVA